MNPTRTAALVVLLGTGLAGCASVVPRLEAPDLSVVDVQMQESTLFEQRFLVTMRVLNPNDRDLPVRGIDYNMELMGEKVGRGLTNQAFTVPAMGEATFDMTVTTNLATGLLKLLPKLQRGETSEIEYRIVGKVSTQLGVIRSIPFDEKGTLKLGERAGSTP